jgi:hypothetical protein
MLEELPKLVWRYESEECSESYIAERFEEERNCLVEQLVLYDDRARGLLYRPSKLKLSFENAVSAALELTKLAKFKEALVQFERGRDALQGIAKFLEAQQEYRKNREIYETIVEMIKSDYLKKLTSMRILAQLLSEVEDLLKAEKHHQAQIVARLCLNRAGPLLDVEKNPGNKSKELLAQLNEFAQVCDRSTMFIVHPNSNSSIKSAVLSLQPLVGEGYLVLTEMLMGDLEVEISPRRTLVFEYRSYIEACDAQRKTERVSLDELREIVLNQSWFAATDHLLEIALSDAKSEINILEGTIEMMSQSLIREKRVTAIKRP